MKNLLLLVIIGFLGVVSWTSPVGAQGAADWSFVGGFQVGFRSVDVDGSEAKYRQHLNLEDGPRLFNLNFELTPSDDMRHLFDRMDLAMTNLGGDPFETIRFSVKRYGHFSLTYDRRKSTFFYDDTILPPELSDPELSNVGDLHRFDVDRVHDTVDFRLNLSSAARLDFGFDRLTRQGRSSTTMDIQRDEFELDQPIDESMSEYRLGFTYAWSRVTLVVEGRLRDYENAVEIFLPGFSQGEHPDDDAVLASYFLDRPYNLRSVTPSLRLVARPTDRLNIKLYAAVEDLEMDVDLHEEAVGTTFEGDPYESSTAGDARVERTTGFYDLDLDYRILDWFGVIGGVRQRDLEQDGDLVFGADDGSATWRMDTLSAYVGLQFEIGPRFTVTGGLSNERRDVDWGWEQADSGVDENERTDHRGAFVTVGWRPTKELRLSGRLDDGSSDNPFTATSPSDRSTYRIAAQWARGRGFSISGVIRGSDITNDASGWSLRSRSANLRLGYRLPGLSLSAGYTFIDVDRQIDQTVTTLPGFGGGETLFFPIFYEADSDFFDARIVWAAARRIKIGGQARWYENRGSFAVTTSDLSAFIEVGFGKGYIAHLGYRDRDYDEADQSWDDYRAKIVEASVGYRW